MMWFQSLARQSTKLPVILSSLAVLPSITCSYGALGSAVGSGGAAHYSHSSFPATGHRPPATGHHHRPPATRPPATGHRPPATGHRPPATGHRPPATGHGHRPPALATDRDHGYPTDLDWDRFWLITHQPPATRPPGHGPHSRRPRLRDQQFGTS